MMLSDAKWVAPLLAAVAEGKTLQVRDSTPHWIDLAAHNIVNFTSGVDAYRIKPEPRSITPIFTREGRVYSSMFSEKDAKEFCELHPGYTYAKFVEVQE